MSVGRSVSLSVRSLDPRTILKEDSELCSELVFQTLHKLHQEQHNNHNVSRKING